MARTTQASTTATAPELKAPDFIAWHVSNRGEKAFWTKVGAAWFHRDRKGLSLQLEVVPINGRSFCGRHSMTRLRRCSRALSARPSMGLRRFARREADHSQICVLPNRLVGKTGDATTILIKIGQIWPLKLTS